MYMKSWSIKDAMRIKDVHEELELYCFITRLASISWILD
jgi:hypothetical protein